jgi:methylated-DNA-[protein]-cysteine S-methyltransferase
MALSRRIGEVPGLGKVGVIVSDRGVVSIEVHAWPDQPAMRHRRDPVEEADHQVISAVLAQLEGYVLGRTREFPIACDFHGIPPQPRAAMEAVRKVPWGQTRTYEQLAASIPGGTAPVVRDALARNPLPIIIPCHRALGDGHMGSYAGPLATKRSFLAIEGLDCRKVPDPPPGQGTVRVLR